MRIAASSLRCIVQPYLCFTLCVSTLWNFHFWMFCLQDSEMQVEVVSLLISSALLAFKSCFGSVPFWLFF